MLAYGIVLHELILEISSLSAECWLCCNLCCCAMCRAAAFASSGSRQSGREANKALLVLPHIYIIEISQL